MSLLGYKTAIISLGVSCQTTRQLIRHSKLLSELVGDDLRHRRMPFDWVISGPEASADWIDHDLAFPRSPYDLIPLARESDAYQWRGRRVLFVHDFRAGWRSGLSRFARFDYSKQKYRHFRETFRLAGSLERVVLVVSNTQNNLTAVASAFSEDFTFTSGRLEVLKSAADKYFQRDCELLVLTNQPQSAGAMTIERDSSVWEGNDAGWAAALQAYFAH